MRRTLYLPLSLMLVTLHGCTHASAFAQAIVQPAYISIVASGVFVDLSGMPVSAGTVSVVATDDQNRPVKVNVAGAQLPLGQEVVRQIASGSLAMPLQLPNPLTATPSPLRYRMTVRNTGVVPNTITVYTLVTITADSNGRWNFASLLTGPAAAVSSVRGAAGLQGPQGVPGVAGLTGANGLAATITIGTVTTGTTAAVTNSGTPTNAVLNFVLPLVSPGVQTPVVTTPVVTTPTGTQGWTGPQTTPFSAVSLGDNPNMNGFLPFCPAPTYCSDIYRPVKDLSVDAARNLAFHSGPYNYENAGLNADFGLLAPSLEYHVVKPSVDPAMTMVPTITSYTVRTGLFDSQSVDTLFPYKPGYTVEGGGTLDTCDQKTGDVHPLIVNADDGFLTESYVGVGGTGGFCNGKILMGQTTVWNLMQPIEAQLPGAQTSTDAAGLPVFGLGVRPEDVKAGILNPANGIKHALRVTFPHLQGAFKNAATNGQGGPPGTAAGNDTFALVASPARHSAGLENGAYQTYPGQRLRINPAKDISGCGAQAQVIMQAGKDYGFIVADIGNTFEIQGNNKDADGNSYWDGSQLSCMFSSIKVSDLQVVTLSPLRAVDLAPETPTYGATLMYDQSAKTAYNQGAGPAVTLPAIPAITSYSAVCSGGPISACPLGSTVTLTAAATGANNMVVGHAGPIAGASGSVTIKPTASDTYILTAYNGSGYEVSDNTSGHIAPASINVAIVGPTVATPAFSPLPGNFSAATTIAVSDATPGAVIHITQDGSTPTRYSPVYTGPVTTSTPKTLYALAVAPNMLDSSTSGGTYLVNIPNAPPSVVGSDNSGSMHDGSTYSATHIFSGGTAAVLLVAGYYGAYPDTVVCGPTAATLIARRVTAGNPGAAYSVSTYYIPSMPSGSATCSATFNGGSYAGLIVSEVAGTSGVDTFSSGTGAATGVANCGSLTTTGPNRLLVVASAIPGYGASTGPSSPYNLIANLSGAFTGATLSMASAETRSPSIVTSGDNADTSCVAFALKP